MYVLVCWDFKLHVQLLRYVYFKDNVILIIVPYSAKYLCRMLKSAASGFSPFYTSKQPIAFEG